MKKLLIILLALALLGFIAFWVFVGFGSKQTITGSNGGNVTLPLSGNVPTSTSGSSMQDKTSFTVAGSGGVTIPTRDFLRDSTAGEYPNRGYYYLGYHTSGDGVVDPTATNDPPYLIEYIKSEQYFIIELLKEPIGTTRLIAEQYLMAHLGISQDQMCQLNYSVSVPNRVNSQYASKNLGFSFCLGATKLPN
ncbi:MAG: hypothetical protein NTU85_02495 [Candidatus Kaiserbacteria bacterium]|nr:hypothetical protein [Candidatus Kaiserbacteria bacterium]